MDGLLESSAAAPGSNNSNNNATPLLLAEGGGTTSPQNSIFPLSLHHQEGEPQRPLPTKTKIDAGFLWKNGSFFLASLFYMLDAILELQSSRKHQGDPSDESDDVYQKDWIYHFVLWHVWDVSSLLTLASMVLFFVSVVAEVVWERRRGGESLSSRWDWLGVYLFGGASVMDLVSVFCDDGSVAAYVIRTLAVIFYFLSALVDLVANYDDYPTVCCCCCGGASEDTWTELVTSSAHSLALVASNGLFLGATAVDIVVVSLQDDDVDYSSFRGWLSVSRLTLLSSLLWLSVSVMGTLADLWGDDEVGSYAFVGGASAGDDEEGIGMVERPATVEREQPAPTEPAPQSTPSQ